MSSALSSAAMRALSGTFPAPLVFAKAEDLSRSVSSLNPDIAIEDYRLHRIAEFGNNVLLGLRKKDQTAYAIVEMNPETGALVGTPYKCSIGSIEALQNRWVAVHKNVIYVNTSEGIVMMDSLGIISGKSAASIEIFFRAVKISTFTMGRTETCIV